MSTTTEPRRVNAAPIEPSNKASASTRRFGRSLKRTALSLAAIVALSGLAAGGLYLWALTATGDSLLARALIWSDSDIGDIERFPSRAIRAGDRPMGLAPAPDTPFDELLIDGEVPFDTFLADTDTTAFIALRGHEILYEGYFDGGGHNRLHTSMSAAKSFTSTLVGIAIDEGHIGGLDDPVTEYIPELLERDARFAGMTLRHLITMTSGLRYEEWTSPWDDPTRTYYATDLRATALGAVIVDEPGTVFRYNDYNPLLLGIVLERATGMSVSDYLETRLWRPMGAEADASWSLDSTASGFEKMSTGLNAVPRDYARFGRLVLDGGRRGDAQVIPAAWIAEATRVDGSNHNTGYQYFWWVDAANSGFDAEGDHCQFVYLHPDSDVVLVRLGRTCGGVYWTGLLGDIAEWIEADGS